MLETSSSSVFCGVIVYQHNVAFGSFGADIIEFAFLRLLYIAQQCAASSDADVFFFQDVRGILAHPRYYIAGFSEIEFAFVEHAELAYATVFDGRERTALLFHPGIAKNLRGTYAQQQVVETEVYLCVYRRSVEFARRNVSPANARFTVFQAEGEQIVVGIRGEHIALHHGPGSYHADDIARCETFCGDVRLFAYRYFMPGIDELGDIPVHRVERYPAHGGALFQSAVSSREHEVEFFACDLRILEEHLVKIPEAEHEYAVTVLFLDLEILFHHRRQCHFISPPYRKVCCFWTRSRGRPQILRQPYLRQKLSLCLRSSCL